MRHFLIGSGFVLACLLASGAAAQAKIGACEPPGLAIQRAQFDAAQAGGAVIQLSGEQAERFLEYLNEKVGHYTDIWGDGVVIARYPALGYDSVAVVDDGCVDETKMIRLDPPVTSLALQAAESNSW